MKAALFFSFIAAAFAAPAVNDWSACAGSYPSAQCCATDVLGVADLNCVSPPIPPKSSAEFNAACASVGQQAKCCALPILGQALVCQNPV